MSFCPLSYSPYVGGHFLQPFFALPFLLALVHTLGLHLLLIYRVGVLHLLAFSFQ
jgi:hypothetical protein